MFFAEVDLPIFVPLLFHSFFLFSKQISKHFIELLSTIDSVLCWLMCETSLLWPMVLMKNKLFKLFQWKFEFYGKKKSLLFWINLINWNQIICFKVMKSSQIMSTNRSSPLCLSFKTLKSYYIPRKWMWWQRQRSELLMVRY